MDAIYSSPQGQAASAQQESEQETGGRSPRHRLTRVETGESAMAQGGERVYYQPLPPSSATSSRGGLGVHVMGGVLQASSWVSEGGKREEPSHDIDHHHRLRLGRAGPAS